MALVVETGSGLSNAESYCSVADATAFNDGQQAIASWGAASTTAQENALRQATLYIDGLYGQRFPGQRYSESQALRWPRSNAFDDEGVAIGVNTIPTKLRDATAEIAIQIVAGTPPFVTEKTPGDLTAKTVKLGDLMIAKEFSGAQKAQPDFPKARALLASLIGPKGERVRA